jgi:hypothetical protein
MNAGDKIKVVFDGKEIDVTVVQEGVVQKTASIFYIKDVVTGEWLYCFPARLAKLQANPKVDLANYKGRDTKAKERKELKAQKAAEKAAKAQATPAPAPAPAAPAAAEPVEAAVEEEVVPLVPA